jgi:thiopeptide-type bacteriocin biosynthesis protein
MSLDRDFVASRTVVLRTPLLPFEEIEAWSAGLLVPRRVDATSGETGDGEAALTEALAHDRALLRERLRALLARPEIAEAVFLASPDLVQSLGHWLREPEGKKGQRTEHGLVRYVLRMASRPTPFGLFSGCTAGTVGESRRLALAARPAYRRHSRLDMDYLFALCDHLTRSEETRAEILFRPNSTLHEAAGRLRYAESRLAGRLRTYHLVAVDAFDALESTLERAAEGARLCDLAAALVAEDPEQEITLADAEAFLHDLVDNQILLPELSLPVTGEESTPGLLRQLAAVPSAAAAGERLAAAERALADVDSRGLGSPADAYRAIARELEPLGVPVEMSRLFQVDLVKPGREVAVDPVVIAEILRGVEILHRVAPAWGGGPLEEFRNAFRDRYGEGREVPLLAALDEESSIGYERSNQAAAEASPLLSGLLFRPRVERPTIGWARREAVLLRLLAETLASGKTELALGDADLERLETPERPPLPDAFHVMTVLAASSPAALAEGDFRLLVEHAAGPSGARILGRFCHIDDALRAGVEAHLAAEEALAPDAVFAEIVHLPEGRIGNILARPLLRRYEIPFLGRSGVPRERQIPADDLLVTVVGERVRLRSRRLGREVVPRLTNAHNTARESLGLYRFLAALQGQGRMGSAAWSWGALQAAPFLPRVVTGRLVLARAQWRLLQPDVEPLAKTAGAARYRLAQRWRRERRMPRFVALVDGDNELLLDFENPLSLDSVVELIKSREEVGLTELYPGPGELCAEGPEGRFFHELVVPFVRRPAEEPRPVEARPATASIAKVASAATPAAVAEAHARIFPPGSKWLYAKLYAGTATADQVLRDEIASLARQAMAAGAAHGWFFIRYNDPHWHLRVRFRGVPERLRAEVLPLLEGAFGRLLEAESVWKCQLDTYEREVERYGEAGIELAEELFFHDSEAVVAILESLTADAGAELRWRLILAGMDRLLDDFGYDPEAKLRLAERGRAGVAGRWRHEALREPVADRLRPQRAALERLLVGGAGVPKEAAPGFAALARRSAALAPVVAELRARERRGRLRPPLADIVPSFVHMFVNRLSRSAGPEHEMVLYDFLVQLYRSQQARARSAAAAAPTERLAATAQT